MVRRIVFGFMIINQYDYLIPIFTPYTKRDFLLVYLSETILRITRFEILVLVNIRIELITQIGKRQTY